jgi:hypothetical protein
MVKIGNPLKKAKLWVNWLNSHKRGFILILLWVIGAGSIINMLGFQIPTWKEFQWEYPESEEDPTFEHLALYAAEWLSYSVKSNGKYKYLYDLDSGRYPYDYNFLRHWGSSYSLAMANDYFNSTEINHALIRSIDWGLKHFFIFQNDSDIGFFHYYGRSTTGGVALAVMALAQYQMTSNDSTYYPYLARLGNYLLWAQQPGGWIRSYYINNGSTTCFTNTSYYPGEAILALSLLYQLTDDNAFLDALSKAYHFYRNTYEWRSETPFIPWAVSGYSLLYETTKNMTYASFAFEMMDYALRFQNQDFTIDEMGNNITGGFYSTPSIATSSYLEALSSTYRTSILLNDTGHMD